MRALDLPLLGRLVAKRIKPSEAYPFWNHYYGGFGRPCRDLEARDLSPRAKARIGQAMGRFLTPKRERLLVKITGWARLGFIDELFPGTRFIHVVRDWRAVANSTMNVHVWNGWMGTANSRWGLLSPQDSEAWEGHDRSFVALAGIQLKILLAALDRAKTRLNHGSLLEITYEDLCERPAQILDRVCDFCHLQPAGLERALERTRMHNTNHKWRQDLTPEQQLILETVLEEPLKRHGYL